jgi:small subunit ribosomal protein S20
VANVPSAEKRNRQRIRRRQRNLSHLTRVRTYVKRVQAAIEMGETGEAGEAGDAAIGDLLKQAVKLIDKAAQKGVLKRETASRKISRLTRAVASMQ